MKNDFITSSGGPYILCSESIKYNWNAENERLTYDSFTPIFIGSDDIFELISIDNFKALVVMEPEVILKINDISFIQVLSSDLADDDVNSTFIENIVNNKHASQIKIFDINIDIGKYVLFDAAINFWEANMDNNYIVLDITAPKKTLKWKYFELNNINFYHFEFLDG